MDKKEIYSPNLTANFLLWVCALAVCYCSLCSDTTFGRLFWAVLSQAEPLGWRAGDTATSLLP